MCHTVIWDVQYGKIRVKYETAYYTNTPYDTALMYSPRKFWQANHQLYGRIRCIYTVLTNPLHARLPLVMQSGHHTSPCAHSHLPAAR